LALHAETAIAVSFAPTRKIYSGSESRLRSGSRDFLGEL
jgi:hypothetical protein